MQEQVRAFTQYFLSHDSAEPYRKTMSDLAGAIATQITGQAKPYNGQSPAELKAALDGLELFPENGMPLEQVLEQTRMLAIESNISVYHAHCLAHLHCPTFIASLAAEMIISAFNQSMDSWDQAPAATLIEQAVCDQLCRIYGFGREADAVFTGGGTMSNFMGLLLARDHFSQTHFGWDIQQKGLPPQAGKFRILCGEDAHFTVVQSASILGLGQDAVVKIPGHGEQAQLAEQTIIDLKAAGLCPIAYVTTAGTTDFGAIAAIDDLADCAQRHSLWLHVDAAYGGALQFSEKHRHRLKGISRANSVTIDFHKLFYQPISCGVFLLRDKSHFDLIRLHAAYLNPESNGELGIPDLVYKSIQTTRRFDALKPFIAMQHVGTRRFGEMIDHTIALAEQVCDEIEQDEDFELAFRTPLNAVVFRYIRGENEEENDRLNSRIKTDLLLSGAAIVGQTSVNDRSYLKFTLLNPMTTLEDVRALLLKVKETAAITNEA